MLTVDELLWACAIVGSVWALVPALFHALGLTSIRAVIDEDPASAIPQEADEPAAARFEQLQKLGFQPIGKVYKTAWFFCAIHWARRFVTRYLATPDGKCFAAMYRLRDREPVRICLTTITSGRGMVRTAMPGAGLEVDEPTYLRTEMKGCHLADLFARHKLNVQRFSSQRGLAAISETLQGQQSVDLEIERNQLRNNASVYVLPGTFFLLPGIICLIALFSWFGSATTVPVLAIAAAFASTVYFLFLAVILPAMMTRICIASHQGSEIRGQRLEVRGQRSDTRGQRTEIRGQKSEAGVSDH